MSTDTQELIRICGRLPAAKLHFAMCYTSDMKAALAEPQIVTRKGKPISVIIPIEAYEELLERAQEAADLAWLRKARRKPLQYRSLDEYLNSRRGAGRIGLDRK